MFTPSEWYNIYAIVEWFKDICVKKRCDEIWQQLKYGWVIAHVELKTPSNNSIALQYRIRAHTTLHTIGKSERSKPWREKNPEHIRFCFAWIWCRIQCDAVYIWIRVLLLWLYIHIWCGKRHNEQYFIINMIHKMMSRRIICSTHSSDIRCNWLRCMEREQSTVVS